jgi:hypothetical protein
MARRVAFHHAPHVDRAAVGIAASALAILAIYVIVGSRSWLYVIGPVVAIASVLRAAKVLTSPPRQGDMMITGG